MNGIGRGDENPKKPAIFTRETVGMILLLFSALILLFTATGRFIFGDIGQAIAAFFVGLAGFFAYPLLIFGIYGGVSLVAGKSFIPRRWLLRGTLVVLGVFFIVHTATAERFFIDPETSYAHGYGPYLAGCWSAASSAIAEGTGGGVLFGLIAYPVRLLLSAPGAYIVFSILTVLAVFYFLMLTPLKARLFPVERRPRETKRERKEMTFDDLEPQPRSPLPEPGAYAPAEAPRPAPAPTPAPAATEDPYARSRDILFRGDPAASYRSNLIFNSDSAFNRTARRSSVQPVREEGTSYAGSYSREAEQPRESMPKRVISDEFNYPERPSYHAPDPAPTPVRPEPLRSEPVRSEPLRSEPLRSEPVRPEPVRPERMPAPEDFSSAPNVFDEPELPKPSYLAEPEPPKPAPREEEPARPVPPAPPATPGSSRTTMRVGFGDSDEPPARSFDDMDKSDRRESLSFDFGRRDRRTPDPTEGLRRTPDPTEGLRRTPDPTEGLRRTPDPTEGLRRTPDQTEGLRRTPDSTEGLRRTPDPTEGLRRTSDPTEGLRRTPDPTEGLRRTPEQTEESERETPERRRSSSLFDDNADEGDFRAETSYRVDSAPADMTRGERGMRRMSERQAPLAAEVPAPEPAPAPKPKKHVWKPYKRPNIAILRDYGDKVSVSNEEIEQNSELIVDTFAAFRIDVQVVRVTTGATFTRYDITIPSNISVNIVVKKEDDIAMRLRVANGVKMYANREFGTVSIEVPNRSRATVGLQSVLMSDEYMHAKPNSLMFAIGKDVEGRCVCGNIVKMKHLLVAGATGSGKSVCLNSMLISLICKYSPEDLRLILIDPKRVEFAVFAGLPHLMINEIIAEPQKAVTALNWAIKEMERRYGLFEKKTREERTTVRNIDEFNDHLGADDEKLPKIVIVFDELADFMAVAKKDIEDRIQRLAAKARAAGIHLVLATQRPSVNIITGVIKGNLPTRFAFKVAAEVDSRTILDETGAQKLLGYGDLLYHSDDMFESKRVQGAFLSSEEVQAIVDDIKEHNETYFDNEISDYINKSGENASDAADGASENTELTGATREMYVRALAIVVKIGQASISLIQRKCSVGYNHAGKIIEWMEAMGYISPFDGKAKARTVLLTPEEFRAKYGDID